MHNFNNLSHEEKKNFQERLLNCANNFGGQNFFLQLIEELRESQSQPLCSRHQDFLSEFGTIRWGKTIFNDKIDLIKTIRPLRDETGNILPPKEDKRYKLVFNLIRTLQPITFSVRPSLREDGEGFDFPAFEEIDETSTHLNPIFEALFFSNIENVKKVLNYKN